MDTPKTTHQEIVELSDGRRVRIAAWPLVPTRNHILSVKEIFASAVKAGLVREGDLDISAEYIASVDLAALLSDDNLTRICQMIADATASETPLSEKRSEQYTVLIASEVQALNQFDIEALVRATWNVNIRPRMALLGRLKRSTGPSPKSPSK